MRRIGGGFVQQVQHHCNRCDGEGKIMTSTCHMCKRQKTKRALDELYLFVEKGTPDNHEEHFKDAADEFVNARAGEVIFKIQESPHSRFTR